MTPPLTIAVKRIYEPAGPEGGARFLVDRLWPRGVSKEKAALTAWLKPLSPSDGLRAEFHHAAALAELDAAMKPGPVTLVYAAKDEERNNAVALREWLERR